MGFTPSILPKLYVFYQFGRFWQNQDLGPEKFTFRGFVGSKVKGGILLG